ncbi:uncharacterized protein LOC128961489 [Oppia nitens]|uniref:uncharacterized protein LOC128961489 n=1 Tax=Oppia nitens TaxID=1686743 RepID=UPI0023DBAF80|nr:uncharacterized protein LOC128961489 [Oppia nitens]
MSAMTAMDLKDYYERVIVNNKKWFICKTCDETELLEEAMITHIRQHLLHPSDDESDEELMYEQEITSNNTRHQMNDNRIQDNWFASEELDESAEESNSTATNSYANQMRDSSDMTSEKVFKVQKIGDRNVFRDQKESHRLDKNYVGMQSLKRLKGFYKMEVIDNQKTYFCEYNKSCGFRAKRTQTLALHINCTHIKERLFRCRIRGCDKVYFNPNALRKHELNHRCGFGIANGKQMTGICGNQSINRFRKRIIENDCRLYKCIFMDCPFKTRNHMSIKVHIHDQHLCPFRVMITECTTDADMPHDSDQQIYAESGQTTDDLADDDSNDEHMDEMMDHQTNSGSHQHNDNTSDFSYTDTTYDNCLKELSFIQKIRPYFKANGKQYVCLKCEFNAKSLSAIETHLRLKHFIQ